jgi:hypothetical protein
MHDIELLTSYMTSSVHFKQLFERVRNFIRHVMSLTSLISRLTL